MVAVVVIAVVTAATEDDEDEFVDELAVVVSFVMSVKLSDFLESDSRLARRAVA